MSQLRAFYEYVRAFELAYLTDDWSILEPFFAPEAVHVVTGGGPHDRHDRGPGGIARGFREAVHAYDRRFDLRIPEVLEGPVTRDDGVWMRFLLTVRRAGLPDLSIEGEHLVRYVGEKIAAIEERVLGDGGAGSAAFLAKHESALRPPSTGPVEIHGDPRDLEDSILRSLVRCYGAAKSERDTAAALSVCHESFSIDTIPFGVTSRDRAETAGHLALFFDAFPDYRVRVEGLIARGGRACLWGRARMSLRGSGLGVAPTGKTADLPISCVFETRDGLLAREVFFFDLAQLCDQIEVPVEDVRRALGSARAAAA